MKKMTLTNNFHNTEITILVPDNTEDQKEAWEYLQSEALRVYPESSRYGTPVSSSKEYRRLKHVQDTLCSDINCYCGTVR